MNNARIHCENEGNGMCRIAIAPMTQSLATISIRAISFAIILLYFDPLVLGNEESLRFENDFALQTKINSESYQTVTIANDPSHSCPCFRCRPTLTGDWSELRPRFASKGVTLDADLTQFYFGVASGGAEQKFNYAGHGDYILNVDFEKLTLQDGLTLKIRAEHLFGQSIAEATGDFMPADVFADIPLPADEELFITNFLFTQAVSESFSVFAGKADLLDGDANAFAHGRGKTQFSNVAFVVNPVAIRLAPYSSLAAGCTASQGQDTTFMFCVFNATNTTRTCGFRELFSEGLVLIAEMRTTTHCFDLPGHQLIGGAWNSRVFSSMDEYLHPNLPIPPVSGTWTVYYNFDQYLQTYADDPLRGWGLFGRVGVGDSQTNPHSWFLSCGVGGDSPFLGREKDAFGAGWYYLATSPNLAPILADLYGGVGDGQGVELFYNAALTQWLNVTPDFQVILPAREDVSPAVVVGLRVKAAF